MCVYTCTNDSSNNRMLVATRPGMLLIFPCNHMSETNMENSLVVFLLHINVKQ